MFLFQTGIQASGKSTAAGNILSAQEFSKKVDQLYVRTKVAYDMLQDQYGRSTTKFKNFLNTSMTEKLGTLVPLRERKLGEKATALIASEATYYADFKGFEKKYNALKDALRGNDPKKIESAMAGISRNYFELLGSQARFAQLLNDYDIRGAGYAKSVLELTLDMAMAAGIITGVGGIATLTREGLAVAMEAFMAKGARESAKRAYAGAMFFTALGVGSEYYSFNKLSSAMKKIDTDAAGALGELSTLLHGTAKRAGSDGENLEEVALAVDGARAELMRGLKADASFRLEPGRVAGCFGESFIQLFIFDAGLGFFKAAGKAEVPTAQEKKMSQQLNKELLRPFKASEYEKELEFLNENAPQTLKYDPRKEIYQLGFRVPRYMKRQFMLIPQKLDQFYLAASGEKPASELGSGVAFSAIIGIGGKTRKLKTSPFGDIYINRTYETVISKDPKLIQDVLDTRNKNEQEFHLQYGQAMGFPKSAVEKFANEGYGFSDFYRDAIKENIMVEPWLYANDFFVPTIKDGKVVEETTLQRWHETLKGNYSYETFFTGSLMKKREMIGQMHDAEKPE
ncbi:MAG: hypothetical protein NTX79_03700 [Candidatus Micrarchaeota archaeon]|nr:hypothetical protein [Candidatus Micrarchaeota archaeon]